MSTPQRKDTDSEGVDRELRGAARGGAITFVGSFFTTAMGFVLTLTLATTLGATGSGLVLQTMAAFMIALSLCRLGMDTTAVWMIPRVVAATPERVRSVCLSMTGFSLLAGGLGVLVWWLCSGLGLVPALQGAAVAELIDTTIWVLPVGALTFVALAATRGLGGVLPFNLIQNILVPGLRPPLVLLVTGRGGGALAAANAWAAPFALAAVLAVAVLVRQVGALERRHDVRGAWRPEGADVRRMLGFALPRTWAAALEQSILWMDVILVGILAGPAAAGIYGAASRFVGAGVVVLHAFRIVVAPRFSAMLGDDRTSELQRFYTVTATWILLFGAPIYVMLAFFSPTVLGWLGPEFREGVTSMVILCTGALVLLAAGNVQTLLLMSGRSGWGAVNKTTVFVVNLVGNLILVPLLGIEGAAITWASCMTIDTLLATVQVRRFTSIGPSVARVLRTLAAVAATVAVPCVVVLSVRENDLVSLLIAGVAAVALWLSYMWLDRRHLHFDQLAAMSRSRMGRGSSRKSSDSPSAG